jgi:hypothetical protein
MAVLVFLASTRVLEAHTEHLPKTSTKKRDFLMCFMRVWKGSLGRLNVSQQRNVVHSKPDRCRLGNKINRSQNASLTDCASGFLRCCGVYVLLLYFKFYVYHSFQFNFPKVYCSFYFILTWDFVHNST